jgi:hypothetical protein
MGRLLRAPGDVLADGQGFARVGADGRVLVTNGQDLCPECGCGGDVPRVCCAGAWQIVNNGLTGVFPCDVTPTDPGEPGPLLDWCLGTGQLRHTLIRATASYRTRNPLPFGFYNINTGSVTVATPLVIVGLRTIGASWGANRVPASGQIRSQVFTGSPSDTTRQITSANVSGAAGVVTALRDGAPARTGRSSITGISCNGTAIVEPGLRVIGRVFGPDLPGGVFSGGGTAGFENPDRLPSGTHTAVVGIDTATLTIARQWSVTALSATVLRVRATESVAYRRVKADGAEELDATFDTEYTTETLSPCPPVGGLSVGGEVENPTRWMGLEWEGEPMPLRVLSKLLGRPSSGCGCGCIRPLKRLWRRLLGAVPHPASA